MDLKKNMAVMSDKEKTKLQKPKQTKTPSQPLTQKQILGIALLIVGVILIGIAILTW